MLEWLKRHAWKACVPQKGIASSNLALSAKKPALCVGFVASLLPPGTPLMRPRRTREEAAIRRANLT